MRQQKMIKIVAIILAAAMLLSTLVAGLGSMFL